MWASSPCCDVSFGLRVAAVNDKHQGRRPAHAHAFIHAFITAPHARRDGEILAVTYLTGILFGYPCLLSPPTVNSAPVESRVTLRTYQLPLPHLSAHIVSLTCPACQRPARATGCARQWREQAPWTSSEALMPSHPWHFLMVKSSVMRQTAAT